MLVFDLATTAINNYMDYEKAHSEVYKYEENVIGRRNLSPVLIRNMILAMIAFVFVIGVILTINTGWLLLLMGFICCFIEYSIHSTDSFISNAFRGNFQWGDYGPWNFCHGRLCQYIRFRCL